MKRCLKNEYLQRMGIDVWLKREQSVPLAETEHLPDREQADKTPANDVTQQDWSQLRDSVAACQLCALHNSRTQTVFGVGEQKANLLIIGEAPGFDEDKQGEPFVGKAGQLLNEMLKAIGLSREQVFIANILKCRPPNNRDPKIEEAKQCAQYLKRQIMLIQPTLILAVGRISAQRLLNTEQSLSALRGKLHHYADSSIPIWITYHPAYLLRKPSEKRKAWQDLIKVQSLLMAK